MATTTHKILCPFTGNVVEANSVELQDAFQDIMAQVARAKEVQEFHSSTMVELEELCEGRR